MPDQGLELGELRLEEIVLALLDEEGCVSVSVAVDRLATGEIAVPSELEERRFP